jgi:hypothetical protein
LHLEQDVQHAVAVLAAAEADHDLVAVFDHVEVHDRLAHQAAQTFFELVSFALDLQGALRRQRGGFGVDPDSTHGRNCLTGAAGVDWQVEPLWF